MFVNCELFNSHCEENSFGLGICTGSVFDGEPRWRLPLEEIGPNFIEAKELTDDDSCPRPKSAIAPPFVDPRW